MKYEWIAYLNEGIPQSELYKEIAVRLKDMAGESIYLAMLTDSIKMGDLADLSTLDYSHLIELRVFNDKQELKAWRGSVASQFYLRLADDNHMKKQLAADSDSFTGDYNNRIYRENQYLDIDEKRSIKEEKEGFYQVHATGGGAYWVPTNKKNATICIQNYLDYYEETGQTVIADWRIVGFDMEVQE